MFDRASTFGDALDSPAGRAVLETHLPGIAASPMATQFRGTRLGQIVPLVPALEDPAAQERLWNALAALDDGDDARPPYAPAIEPDPAYEGEEVGRGQHPSPFPHRPRSGASSRSGSTGRANDNPFVGIAFAECEDDGALVGRLDRGDEGEIGRPKA